MVMLLGSEGSKTDYSKTSSSISSSSLPQLQFSAIKFVTLQANPMIAVTSITVELIGSGGVIILLIASIFSQISKAQIMKTLMNAPIISAL